MPLALEQVIGQPGEKMKATSREISIPMLALMGMGLM
jgi:hypothetical protein